jgi:light-independent protochlorophyllide reductase subunit B
MFRDDFEFNDAAGPSHLGAGAPAETPAAPIIAPILAEGLAPGLVWTREAEAELSKIPFFVRGKARRNTETFAAQQGLVQIHIETLYDARSHFSR